MKKFVGLGLAIALMGTSVQAQDYSVPVTGPNGVAYNCLPEVVEVNGVPSRSCVRADVVAANPGLFSGGLSGGGAIVGVVVVLLALSLLGSSDSTTST